MCEAIFKPGGRSMGYPGSFSSPASEDVMNWDTIKGQWKQFKGKAKQQWGKLTDDELDQVEGKKDELVGKIQEKYGYTREQAEKEVESFCQSC
jgi:uncharacterized protein YjbJ (UPF0337 family)